MSEPPNRVLLALLLLVGACAPAVQGSRGSESVQAQASDPKNGTIAMGCGYLVVENHGAVHFTAFLTGHDMQQVRRGMPVFVMDDVLLETATTTAQAIGHADSRGPDLLRKYMEWETDYISATNHWSALHPAIEQTQSSVPGVQLLLWTYKPPTPGQVFHRTVARVMYLTAALDDVVFSISAPMRPEDDPRIVATKLEQVMRTLRRSSNPLDVLELTNQFEQTQDRRKVCAQWGDA